MQKVVCGIWFLFATMLMGQVLEDAKADFKHQERALLKNFLKYMEHQAEIFAEQTHDEKGDRTLAYTARLKKTQEAWLAWADLQALDLIAPEPVGKQEALLWLSKAWLYEQKSRELGWEVGGPEHVNQAVIDDTRVNTGPISKGFDPYLGKVGGTPGVFALQWFGEMGVRGAFTSSDMGRTFRVFGDSSEEGVIEFLFVVAGEDEGIEVKMERRREGARIFWVGRAEVLGEVWMEKVAQPAGGEEIADLSYEGTSGRTRLSLTLGWKDAGKAAGSWAELRSGIPNGLQGQNYAPGYLYLDYWQGGAANAEGATVPAMWFLKQSASHPSHWTGRAIYLNGYEEPLSFTK